MCGRAIACRRRSTDDSTDTPESAYLEAVGVEVQREHVAGEELVANGSVEHAVRQMHLRGRKVQSGVAAQDLVLKAFLRWRYSRSWERRHR